MSNHVNYSVEKFSRAVQELATSADRIQDRLARAAEHLQILYDAHIPETMQNDFADLMNRLNNTDLSGLNDEQASELATKIVSFTLELHHWQVWDAGRK